MVLITTPNRRSTQTLFGVPAILGVVSDSPALRKRKVLLVEDNEDLLTLTTDVFALLGYEVVTATAGDEALRILQARSDIDVLFSDVVMPGLDGVQLGHAARKLHPALHIVLVSGFANVPGGPASTHDFDFILKPYKILDITRVLANGPRP